MINNINLNSSKHLHSSEQTQKYSRIRLCRTFIQNLKENTSFFRLNKRENSISQYLHDPTFFAKAELMNFLLRKTSIQRKFLDYMLSFLMKIEEKIGLKLIPSIWNPYASLKLLWDIIFFLLLIIIFYQIPVEISFRIAFPDSDLMIMIMFLLNILIELNTAYY